MTSDLPKTSFRRTEPFRLGELEVLPASGELRGRRGVERLRPLLMDILLRLAARPGEVVRRETLLEDVWPRRMVNDEVLSRAIAELRTALGDDAREARYIETLPKIGYRLVASVAPVAPSAGVQPQAPVPTPAMPPRKRALPAIAGGAVLAAVALALATWWLAPRKPPANADLERVLAAARPLTSDPSIELGPRFSPDGTRVVFALTEGEESRIVVQSLDGSSRQFIGTPGALRLSPAFFPDGNRIAYWNATRDDCAILEHDLASGRSRTLLDCALAPRSRFDLSADGRYLAFSGRSRPQFPSGLWVMELGGTPAALTTPEPGMGEDLYPRFSPDAGRIAFFRGSESHRQPWIVERGNTASARRIGTHEGLSYGLAWLGPEGPLLVAADWLGFRALNTLDLASGKARLAGARGARFPDVGPAGEIAYENAVYSANLWRVEARAGAAARVLWRSTRYSSQPELSPDGTHVAFASNRDGGDAIYVASLDGEPLRIAFGDSYRYMRPHWSGDGRAVLAVRITAGAAGASIQEAVRLPAAGGRAEVLTALGQSVNDVRESRDGRWLYWGEASGHAMRLLRAPAADPARSERLPLPLVSQYQMNAERLVFAQPQMTALTACRLADFACAPLGVEVAEADLFHWALGSRSLFLRTREGGEPRIARFDLASGRMVAPIAFAPGGGGSSIAVSDDEVVLVVAREDGPTVDLMFARR